MFLPLETSSVSKIFNLKTAINETNIYLSCYGMTVVHTSSLPLLPVRTK